MIFLFFQSNQSPAIKINSQPRIEKKFAPIVKASAVVISDKKTMDAKTLEAIFSISATRFL